VQTQKKYYDLKVKPTVFEKGSWVYYFHPRYYQGKQDKWKGKYLGPYLVVDTPSPVNVTLQAQPKGKKFTVHTDKVKPFYDETPKSWLKTKVEDTQRTEVKRRIMEENADRNNSPDEFETEEELEDSVEAHLDPDADPPPPADLNSEQANTGKAKTGSTEDDAEEQAPRRGEEDMETEEEEEVAYFDVDPPIQYDRPRRQK